MVRKLPGRVRSGFTLLELFVVIAIIGVLVALATTAVFQVQESRMIADTETVIRTVNKVLEQQWRGVLDKAEKEDVSASVMTMAGGDARRARVIWKCLRLKQEFPVSFAEAKAGVPGYLAPKSVYTGAIGASSGLWDVENATCILLALQQNRSGVSLVPDTITGNLLDTNGDGLKELVDSWGKPIVLYRFPVGSVELDALNPAKPGSRSAKFRNPLDPEGTLMDPSWNFEGGAGVTEFEGLCFRVHSGTGATYTPISTYMVPTLVSSGRNRQFGLAADMSVTDANLHNDNVYSFRLGVDKRGN